MKIILIVLVLFLPHGSALPTATTNKLDLVKSSRDVLNLEAIIWPEIAADAWTIPREGVVTNAERMKRSVSHNNGNGLHETDVDSGLGPVTPAKLYQPSGPSSIKNPSL
jgi:hypothetical protein